jgi:type I restriction enzyme S subunit
MTSTPILNVGAVITSTQYGLSDPSDENGSIPIVGMKDIQDGRVNLNPMARVNLSSEDFKKYRLLKGDILLNRTNSPSLVGKAAIVEADADVVFASYLVRITVDQQKASPEYINFWLNSDRGQKKIKALATRAVSQANLNPRTFCEHFYLPIPSLQTQLQIAGALKAWDDTTCKLSALIKALDRRKQGLMQQLLTGRRRLKGFSGKWKLLRADKLFTEISVRNQTAKEPLLSVTQDRGVIPRDMLVGRVTMPAGTVDAFKLVEPDNFVISLRSFQGGLEHSAYRGLVSPAYTVLQASDDVHPAFFRHYFKSTDFVKRLSVAVVGIRDGKQISYTDFRSIKLPLPPVHEQIALSGLLDLADQDIALCRARLNSLQLQKRALMQKLLSGEWRFPTAPAETKNTSQIAL